MHTSINFVFILLICLKKFLWNLTLVIEYMLQQKIENKTPLNLLFENKTPLNLLFICF